MTNLSSAAQNINWLIGNFVNQVPGVNDAVVVSAGGLPMAVSAGLGRDAAGQVGQAVGSEHVGRPPLGGGRAPQALGHHRHTRADIGGDGHRHVHLVAAVAGEEPDEFMIASRLLAQGIFTPPLSEQM